MIKCGYCGRENADPNGCCRECGSPLPESSDQEEVSQDRTVVDWMWFALRWVGTIITIAFFYLLSFGPVHRYYNGKAPVTPVKPMPVAFGPRGLVAVRTVNYPVVVGVFYYPAMRLGAIGGTRNAYSRYLEWWEELPAKGKQ